MIQKPKGTEDIILKKAKQIKYIERLVDEVMDKYNYNYIETPIFESTELFHRSVGDTSDIVTKETYDFLDRGKRKLTLRPEGTAGVVRSYLENKMYSLNNQPVKLYYNGPMFRYERPQAGRTRQFSQFGVEVFNSDDPLIDAEVISMSVNIYKMLGLSDIKVNINTLGDKESRDNYRKKLIEYFTPKIDNLCSDCKERLKKNPLRILDCKKDAENEIIKNAPSILDSLNKESKERFNKVCEYLDILEVPYVINTKVVRGLDYYNHTVFEVEDKSITGGGNVIGAGGRYNSLVEELGGENVPAFGYAAGISRILLALEKEEVELDLKDDIDLFILYVNEEEKKYALYLTNELRMNGFTVETEYLSRSLKAQFKQADRLNSKFITVLNSEDLDNNEIKIKNNKTKEEEIINIDALIYYLEENLDLYEEKEAEYDNE